MIEVVSGMANTSKGGSVTIQFDGSQEWKAYPCVWLPDEVIEKIADAVVRKLGGMESGCGYWDSESRFCSLCRPTAEPRSCDRNICASNEVNGISCDECEIAKYHNLEDDDTPCQNCEVGE